MPWLRAIPLLLCALLSYAQNRTTSASAVQLRIEAIDMKDGVPERIRFVFTNTGNELLRIPTFTPCHKTGFFGRVKLTLNFSPSVPPKKSYVPGDCVSCFDHQPPVLDQARQWKELGPHESLTETYTRKQLFAEEQDSGDYELVGEYDPPALTAEDREVLKRANLEFEDARLFSNHLQFHRP